MRDRPASRAAGAPRRPRPGAPPHRRPERGRPPATGDGGVTLYGWHTVAAALKNPRRRIRSLQLTENAAHRLAEAGIALPVEPQIVRPDAIAAVLPADAVHQGLLAEADPLPALDLRDIPGAGMVLALDQITDPHNVGAILRSAAAFAVTAVVITGRHSPEATGVLAKAASGALDLVPLVEVPNLARGLTALADRGFLLIGLDSAGTADLAATPLAAPLVLVIGAEGKGLRHLTRTICHEVARLDLPGAIKSLNVSNAAALSLYVASRRLAES
jgi:23S rRNA (guanosine2251-2'-O)-methyltransferase